jgi:hypothetical protein
MAHTGCPPFGPIIEAQHRLRGLRERLVELCPTPSGALANAIAFSPISPAPFWRDCSPKSVTKCSPYVNRAKSSTTVSTSCRLWKADFTKASTACVPLVTGKPRAGVGLSFITRVVRRDLFCGGSSVRYPIKQIESAFNTSSVIISGEAYRRSYDDASGQTADVDRYGPSGPSRRLRHTSRLNVMT